MKLFTGRVLLGALLMCVTGACHAQFSRPGTPLGSQPGQVNPVNPTGAISDIPPDPETERALLKQRRADAFLKMHADARTLGELAAKLNAELGPEGDAMRKSDPSKAARDALNQARKIDKLAGEIDRLMRGD